MSTDVLKIDGLKVARARLALPHENGRHISQAKLADRAGLHWVTLSKIERGLAPNTTLDTLGRLADALGVQPIELTSDEPPEAGSPESFRTGDA